MRARIKDTCVRETGCHILELTNLYPFAFVKCVIAENLSFRYLILTHHEHVLSQ